MYSKCLFTDSALFTNKPNENNELKPITTVSIDHVLPKIDLEIEHVIIGVEKPAPIFWVENRSRFRMTHVPKVGSDFRRRFSTPCVFSLSAPLDPGLRCSLY